MQPWPLLLSIPHGGEEIPPEVADRTALEPAERFADSDPFTREIYDVKDRAVFVISAKIARAVVDLNRAPSDLPPKNPDGVVKSHTCEGRAVYLPDKTPDPLLVETLLARYYHPYHEKIRTTLQRERERLLLGLDCHSMAAVGPAIAPDPGKKRPIFCLSNAAGRSAPDPMVERFASALAKAFRIDSSHIAINAPFLGGFITRTYGGDPIPWIQIEMNRSLYLAPPWFDEKSLEIDHERLRWLNARFREALEIFFAEAKPP
ncbi:MAG: N-formylglutamate amidohydrolase [Deltaproteobacteria bacterium]|nr:MAG: N-formylglutamate amidohydrolase [Deltaproteobacteria bacterium]